MRVNYKQVYYLVKDFRKAIDIAKRKGLFEGDGDFEHFPDDCCGHACILLAEFLKRNGIETIYVLGENYRRETHAWLVVKDDRIRRERECLHLSDTVFDAWKSYGLGSESQIIEMTGYSEEDLLDGLGIDITADQFGEEPVYVGEWKSFEYRFKYKTGHEHYGLSERRYIELYEIITSNIK